MSTVIYVYDIPSIAIILLSCIVACLTVLVVQRIVVRTLKNDIRREVGKMRAGTVERRQGKPREWHA